MTRPEYALDYEECTSAELERFVKARQLQSSSTERIHMVTSLREADACAIFRFLDLPAELRNPIYQDLLTLRKSSKHIGEHCWPAILAASKQVCDEGADLLYQSNEVAIVIEARCALSLLSRTVRIVVNGNSRELYGNGKRDESAAWPQFLQRLGAIRVACHVYSGYRFKGSNLELSLNRFLYELYNHLCSSSHLRKIVVSVQHWIKDQDAGVDELDIGGILTPLCFFRSGIEVSFGEMASEVIEDLTAKAASYVCSLGVSVYNQFQQLHSKVETSASLELATFTAILEISEIFDLADHLRISFDRDTFGRGVMIDVSRHKLVVSQLSKLDRLLREVDLESFITAVEARKKEIVSDIDQAIADF